MAHATSARVTRSPAGDGSQKRGRVSEQIRGIRIGARGALWLYALMGFLTLSYELAWTRQLVGMVGSALGAVSIMFAVLMGGMALGSWVGGRFSQRSTRLFRLLGLTFIFGGGTALLSMPLDSFASVVRVHSLVPGASADQAALISLLIAVPVMMLPAVFAGAAFPVLTRIVRGDGSVIAGIAHVLFAQTAGSIAGAVVAGFGLLPSVGVDATIGLCAGISVAAGIACTLAREDDQPAEIEPEAPTPQVSAVTRTALLALLLSGAATMMYEVAWGRELLLVFGSSVYANAVMLAAVLLGLGIGQWRGGKLHAGVPSGLVTAQRLMFLAAFTGLMSLVLTRTAPVLYTYAYSVLPGSLFTFALVQGGLSFAVVLAPALFIGAASPLLIRFASGSGGTSRAAGRAYALNTIGSVIGSLAAGFLLLPLVTSKGAVGIAALLQVGAALALFMCARRFQANENLLPVAAGLAIVGIGAFFAVQAASPLLNLTLTKASAAGAPSQVISNARQWEAVYFKDSSQGRVAVYRYPNGQYVLRGAGMIEGAQSFIDAQTTELLVRIPAAAAASPKRYLVIGLGTGSTTYTALNMQGVESVDTVEINPAVTGATRYFVGDGVTSDKRSRIEIADARTFLASTDRAYDVIVSEPSYPLSPFSAQLFTKEFFEIQRRHLSKGGVAVQWLPAYLLSQDDVRLMMKTFATVYPNSYGWTTGLENGSMVDIILVGVNGDEPLEPAEIEKKVKAAGGDPFVFSYQIGPTDMERAMSDATTPVNTDDRPVLEYATPLRQIEALWR